MKRLDGNGNSGTADCTVRPLYLREQQVSAEYGLSRPLLRKMRMQDEGPPFVKIHRVILYRREAVEAYLRAYERHPLPPRGDTAPPEGAELRTKMV